ncbi:SpoIIE family protein phosphatase [Streptomyces massasporeus]|uniref:SpoIIE family protein phosphatase n=1 Tax=Streptomyces massasporeus TaxID=67324 RepID=UPI0036E52948
MTITGTTHVASPPLGRRLWRAVYHRLELPGWGVCLAGIRLLQAGQRRTPAPVLTRPGAGTEVLWLPAGPPIGTGLGGYESITVPMERGATLLLYTDGLVERRGTDIDVSLRELADLSLPADGALDDLLDTLLSGMAHGAYEDDVAILAARQP